MNIERIYGKDNFKKTCPNCGAAITGDKCEYCGTVFIDLCCIDADKPFFMKIKRGGIVYVANVILTTVRLETQPCLAYSDDSVYFSTGLQRELSMDFNILNFLESYRDSESIEV